MFTQLQPTDYHLVRALFDDLTFNVEVPSILDGNTRGVVYVDDVQAPTTALIWDHLAALFLAGRADNRAFTSGMGSWLAETPLALAQSVSIDALTVTYTPADWATHLPDALPDQQHTEASATST
ncbi:MAG: hypothetical protein ACP5HG_17465, partial [Anaerolineae bacterium]